VGSFPHFSSWHLVNMSQIDDWTRKLPNVINITRLRWNDRFSGIFLKKFDNVHPKVVERLVNTVDAGDLLEDNEKRTYHCCVTNDDTHLIPENADPPPSDCKNRVLYFDVSDKGVVEYFSPDVATERLIEKYRQDMKMDQNVWIQYAKDMVQYVNHMYDTLLSLSIGEVSFSLVILAPAMQYQSAHPEPFFEHTNTVVEAMCQHLLSWSPGYMIDIQIVPGMYKGTNEVLFEYKKTTSDLFLDEFQHVLIEGDVKFDAEFATRIRNTYKDQVRSRDTMSCIVEQMLYLKLNDTQAHRIFQKIISQIEDFRDTHGKESHSFDAENGVLRIINTKGNYFENIDILQLVSKEAHHNFLSEKRLPTIRFDNERFRLYYRKGDTVKRPTVPKHEGKFRMMLWDLGVCNSKVNEFVTEIRSRCPGYL
jgi:hypothetical protein